MEQGGGTFRMGRVVRKIGSVVIYLRDKDGMRAGTMGTGAPQKNEDCKYADIGHSAYRIAQDAVSM